MPPYIFISYSRHDKDAADTLAAELKARGAEVFIDYQALLAGENFIGRLGKEIERADAIVVLISKRAVQSSWVQVEIAWAFSNKRRIVPAVLEDASLNDLFILANLEQVDLRRWQLDGRMDEGIIKLARALGLPEAPLEPLDVPPVQAASPSSTPRKMDDSGIIDKATLMREGLFDLFTRATEIQEEDPDGALFLLNQVVEIDPGYMRGAAKTYAEAMEVKLKPTRIARRLHDAQDAMRAGAWSRAEQAAADALEIDPENAEAGEMQRQIARNIPCAPLYEGAVEAAKLGRWRSVRTVLSHIRETCPDYSDPAGLFIRSLYDGDFHLPLLEWIDIPTGRVTIEHINCDTKPFKIARYPVTNGQFRVFLDDPNGYALDDWWDFSDTAKAWRVKMKHAADVPAGFDGDTQPRVMICWYEAVAFCRWLSALLYGGETSDEGWGVRLPTEVEWQWAGQADAGWRYPWGREFDSHRCNTADSPVGTGAVASALGGIGRTTPVDRYPNGGSPFGVMDMAGNIWEWCANVEPSPGSIYAGGGDARSLRGGSWYDDQLSASVVYRSSNNPNNRSTLISFRPVVAKSTGEN